MASVSAQPHFIFGLRSDVSNDVCFVDEQTLAFPAAGGCVCLNTALKRQRFLPGCEGGRAVRALSLSANRRYLAVSESGGGGGGGGRPSVTVLDLQHEQGRKRKVLSAGELQAQDLVCMAFSPDSRFLLVQAGEPDWLLMLWLWEKQKLLASVRSGGPHCSVTQVSFNPHNNLQLCASGASVLKLYRYSEGSLKALSFPKVDAFNFLCHCWSSEERLVLGTHAGRLLLLEAGELRREINTARSPPHGRGELKKIRVGGGSGGDVEERPSGSGITAIVSLSKGFACSMGPGLVCVFEKTEEGYRRSRDIWIPPSRGGGGGGSGGEVQVAAAAAEEAQEVRTMCVSPSEETLAISTQHRQLYSISMASVDMSKEEQELHFDFVSQSFHSKAISGLSVCLWKPLVATSSLDHSVRIWNYHTKALEVCKEFGEAALSVALHPSGLLLLVGFCDKLQLMKVLMDDMRLFREFTLRGCRECAFSHGGHMFAAVSGNVIHIFSVTSCESVLTLKGHSGKVRSVRWSWDDARLVSCGADGAVYQWSAQSGQRLAESVLRSVSYAHAAFSADGRSVLAVASDLTLREIHDCQILREVPGEEEPHTALAVSRSGRVVFTGTPSGTIRALKYPLPSHSDWTALQAHAGPITKMVTTFDEQFLLCVSEDACLSVWKMVDKEGRGLKSSSSHTMQLEEVLVTKSELEEKAQNMLELKVRLEELQMENEYQLRLRDMNHNEKIKDLNDALCQQIRELQTNLKAMRAEMERQERERRQSWAQAAEKHAKELKDLEVSYSQKLIVEHERFQDLEQRCQELQEDYEEQLKGAAESHRRALDELTESYQARLQDKTQLLTQVQEEAQQQSQEFQEMMKQVEEDEERKIHDIQVKYERKVHAQKENNTSLKGETTIVTQKLYSLQRQMDDRNGDISQLKQERQKLLGLVRSLESDIENLKRQISGHEKTNQDKDNTISRLMKKNQELEKLKFVLDFQLSDLKKQVEPQQDAINHKKERIQRLEAELVQMDKSNGQLTLTVSELKLKLRSRDKEMHKEMQKGKDLETHLGRLKSDLHRCAGFIQEQKKLKESVKTIYGQYVGQSQPVEKNSFEELQAAFQLQREHLLKTVEGLERKLAKSAEEHEKTYANIMKENVTLIAQINQLRKDLRHSRSRLRDCKAQLATFRKASRSRPHSEEGHRVTSPDGGLH